MNYFDHIGYYGERQHLMEGDIEFMKGLLREALEQQRCLHASIALNYRQQNIAVALNIVSEISASRMEGE